MNLFDSRFAEQVQARIVADIQKAYEDFGAGAWIIRDDASATGMAAVLTQAKIAGLTQALKHMEQVHKDMTGRAKDKKDAA